MTLSELLGYASIVVTTAVCLYALVRIWKGTHKPHAFSVMIWVVITVIAFINMLEQDVGIAAYRTGLLAILLTINFCVCCRHGFGYVTRSDWIFLGAAFAAIPLWVTTGNPDIALLWLLAVETAGNVPTFRKAYVLPHEVSPTIFFFVALGQSLQGASVLLDPHEFSWAILLYVLLFPLQFLSLSALVCWRRSKVPRPV